MGECFECGHPAAQAHHVVPQSLGGTKTVPLCEKCHNLVHRLARDGDHLELMLRGKARVLATNPEDVRDYLALGFNVGNIAEILGINRKSVARIAKSHGWLPPSYHMNVVKGVKVNGSVPIPPEIAAMREAGMTYPQIAERLGCGVTKAWKLATGLQWSQVEARILSGEVQPRPRGRPPCIDPAVLAGALSDVDAGMSVNRAAKTHRISRSYLGKLVARKRAA
jgi:hypothetical protein